MQETAILKLDKEYTISLGMNEWVEFEKLSGVNALMDDIFKNISMTHLLQIVYSCLKYCEDCDYTIEKCGELIGAHNYLELIEVLMNLSVAGRPDAKKTDRKKK